MDYLQHHINNPYAMGMNNPFMNQMMTPYNLGMGLQGVTNGTNISDPLNILPKKTDFI